MARLYFSAYRENVGTTAKPVVKIRPKALHSLLMKATAALSIGGQEVTTTASNYTMDVNESISITHQDFDKSDLKADDEVEIYAVAAVATTMQVLYFRKE